jgi:hypothetical protein
MVDVYEATGAGADNVELDAAIRLNRMSLTREYKLNAIVTMILGYGMFQAYLNHRFKKRAKR